MPKIEPVPILLVTYKRLNFLKKAIEYIYHRTLYPHQLLVINNGVDDNETIRYLKTAKVQGYIYDYITLPENKGLAAGFSAGFDYVKDKNKSEWLITTQDDILCPDLRPCWLERMIHLMKKYPDYAGISMRVQRTRRRDIDEQKDLIESPTACPSVFRISKKKDVIEMGSFGSRPHWESTSFVEKVKNIKKKLAMATSLYADHIGFVDNKGFELGYKNYHTYAENRETQHIDQPYPDIDPKTNIPLEINTHRDRHEQELREEYWNYWGLDKRRGNKHLSEDQILLKPYAEKGKGIEIGPGVVKSHPNAIGVDVFPYKTADILGSGDDLWMFKDDELDFVIASHCLEHFPDTKKVLREWKRVLKPGGIIGVCVPDGEIRPGVIRDPHKCIFTKEVLRIIFKFDLGMKPIRWENVPNKSKGHESILVVAQKI